MCGLPPPKNEHEREIYRQLMREQYGPHWESPWYFGTVCVLMLIIIGVGIWGAFTLPWPPAPWNIN